jgi:hypothetical protein
MDHVTTFLLNYFGAPGIFVMVAEMCLRLVSCAVGIGLFYVRGWSMVGPFLTILGEILGEFWGYFFWPCV